MECGCNFAVFEKGGFSLFAKVSWKTLVLEVYTKTKRERKREGKGKRKWKRKGLGQRFPSSRCNMGVCNGIWLLEAELARIYVQMSSCATGICVTRSSTGQLRQRLGDFSACLAADSMLCTSKLYRSPIYTSLIYICHFLHIHFTNVKNPQLHPSPLHVRFLSRNFAVGI